MGREGHCNQVSLTCVGSAHSVWTTLGLPQRKAACAPQVYTAQAPRYPARVLTQVGPVFHALPRSKPLRFSGIPQGHRPGWVCVLCPSQVQAAQATRCLVSAVSPGRECVLSPPWSQPLGFLGGSGCAHLQCAICLFWGADLWLQPSWQKSTIQNPKGV